MEEKIIIIHGYSDCSASFVALKDFLVARGHGKVDTVLYADYESREDSLTFNDVADGLNDAFIKKKLIRRGGKSDYKLKVIVHSTGGLVIRHWIWRYYYYCGTIADCPVTNIVMLAPANFGSPLAHRGKSFLGSLVKGRWKVGDFLEVGKKILDGLELASPFQWELSHNDLLINDTYFTPDKIKTTILVGDKDYDGLRGWVNKPGTDGTVVLAGTNLDTIKLTLDFAKPDNDFDTYQPHKWSGHESVCDIAFGILHGYDHGSIVEDAQADESVVGELILRGLSNSLSDFRRLQQDLSQFTLDAFVKSGKPKYQQFIIHVVDDYGLPVNDFSLEFLIYKHSKTDGTVVKVNTLSDIEDTLSTEINAILTADVHQNSNDKSFRRLLVDHHHFNNFLTSLKSHPKLKDGFVISMKLFIPKISRGIQYDIRNLENIVIYDSRSDVTDVPQFFFENTTTLVELRVDRFNEYVTLGPEARKH